jgi:hypothetical protein
MHCAACGQEIALASGERVGFREECARCGADLHTCKNCSHYDPGAYNHCREPNSERVADRDRQNRCDWFAPSMGRGGDRENSQDQALKDLGALFKK